jgi:hypothetical protein
MQEPALLIWQPVSKEMFMKNDGSPGRIAGCTAEGIYRNEIEDQTLQQIADIPAGPLKRLFQEKRYAYSF